MQWINTHWDLTWSEWSELELSIFNQDLEYTSGFSQVLIAQALSKVTQTSGFSQSVSVTESLVTSNISAFGHSLADSTFYGLTQSQNMGFTQTLISGVTPPEPVEPRPTVSFTQGALILVLRRPIFGDSVEIKSNYVSLKGIQGNTVTRPRSPLVFKKLILTFEVITNWEEAKAFFITTLGSEVTYIDHNGISHIGCVTNDIEYIFEKPNEIGIDKGFTIEFEVAP